MLSEVTPMHHRLFLVVVVQSLVGGAALSACSESADSTQDAAVSAPDAATPDASTPDASTPDAGTAPDTLCLDPVQIRVVITVNFNQGTKDASCNPLARDKWLDGIDPGESIFIVGAVHTESPISDPNLTLSDLFGNWTPNSIQMYDDGTHGDEVSQDGIWTLSFSLPQGLRVGYKYTWGKPGDGWTGTEEWPGNMRLLEIVDVNGDGFVYRADNFSDETTNKDNINLNPNGNGTVTWTTDTNNDGVPDCQEQPVDTDGDCVGDTWHTPTGIGPVTCS
jgi:hypothetical protein